MASAVRAPTICRSGWNAEPPISTGFRTRHTSPPAISTASPPVHPKPHTAGHGAGSIPPPVNQETQPHHGARNRLIIPLKTDDGVTDEHVELEGEPFSCIRNVNRMPPFLMSVVSDSDLWLFAGSNTGLTAGRGNPDSAIFPYQTADKILHQPQATGVVCILVVDGALWEPWSPSTPADEITRNLYKHATGTSVRFEEIHHSLRLRLTWTLTTSAAFGIVRTCLLENLSDSRRQVRLLDGWRHMLPPGVSQDAYSRFSYLASAYMRHESLPRHGLGIYTLNSGISDRAEPCESQRVGVAWTLGHETPTLLLSDRQIDCFRRGGEVTAESEIRGDFGAHLTAARYELLPGAARQWIAVADTGLNPADVIRLRNLLQDPETPRHLLLEDIGKGVKGLENRVAGADAMQQTADQAASAHHFSNVLFNCMRGGTFHAGCLYSRADLAVFLEKRSRPVFHRHSRWMDQLPDQGTLSDLRAAATGTGDAQLVRLAGEYLPLSFSRRHGDPSRPWNRFDIRTRDRNGNPLLGYSGNWRDIFQNWESLAHSYPAALGPMISVFLNASTADGYNPYRITREGIDWETPDPKDPWSHIGYWGDHQIVYLLRLLEAHERFLPGGLAAGLNERSHAYANVPYRIRGFDELVMEPRHSIIFDEALHEELSARAEEIGGDGKLLAGADGEVLLVTLLEKLLVPVLVKLSNLVPGGGVWLNTQRPEWNDANNALAGWGLSVVTVCHLRRYLAFLSDLMWDAPAGELEVSAPVAEFLRRITSALQNVSETACDSARWEAVVELGRAGESHRAAVYQKSGFEIRRITSGEIRGFLETALRIVDATLEANRREDDMFHSYNVLTPGGGRAIVRHLELMLEGQVAALSSGRVGGPEAIKLLEAMRRSSLYRRDQNSYLLYPDKTITPYLDRHLLPPDWRERAPLLSSNAACGPMGLIEVDEEGGARFNADFRNSHDLVKALEFLETDSVWAEAARTQRGAILDLWEAVFHHRSFTGRSGAMFAFEGLGSIYWHMVAKLLLATQETYLREAAADPRGETAARLADAYRSIRSGLGFTKDARSYGAFPTDPYSHTPAHLGAQQPGMTGQVKEEILTRLGELGILIERGRVIFRPTLLQRSEFFSAPHHFRHHPIGGGEEVWKLEANTLAFTLFQVPVCYRLAGEATITLLHADGRTARFTGSALPRDESAALFQRNGSIIRLWVDLPGTAVPPR